MAPTISRRPRRQVRQQQEEVIPESIFDVISPDREQVTKTKEKEDKGPSMTELQAQLAEMNKRLEASERANMALTTTVDTSVAPKEPTLNMEELPDPVTNPQEYAKELTTRTGQYTRDLLNFQTQSNQAQHKQSQNAETLWEDFASAYQPYADDQERMEFVTAQVVKDAARRGLDVQKYMYQHRDRFFSDLAKRYDTVFGKPEDDGETEVELQTTPRRQRQQPQEREEASRTDGIFGGTDQGGPGRQQEPLKNGDMIKDIHDIQKKMGLY